MLALVTLATGCSMQPETAAIKFEPLTAQHPAGETLARLFPSKSAPVPNEFEPTGLTRKDYLSLIAGNVDFWRQHQSPQGAILDPYDKDEATHKEQEKQYSTPAFALAAAVLIKEARRDDLLDHSVRAFNFALTALQKGTTAQNHADFYIPMLMHAHRILKTRVPAEANATWEEQFRALVPEKNYRDTGGGGNWNIVNVCGEAMRRKDKLVATTQLAAQQNYLDSRLERQQRFFTKFGMYDDANQPLAYDAFPRLWLEDMLADGAYDGPQREAVEQFLTLGSFSSLLLMSPSGEWACGGRSAHHQWNEAECAVIGEINAAKWQRRGRPDVAGAFKRMARLGLKSMKRWQRPSGEMWIVKNFGDPKDRLGFEGYSYHSQYNLLPMAMLAIAHERADESIAERPLPAEFSSYVFDLREKYHKVAAASGGYYVLIDTAADPHYDATGLLRVHRRGVELSPLSDSAPEHRVFFPLDAARDALAPAIEWKDGESWIGVADFHRREPPPKPKPGEEPPKEKQQRVVKETHPLQEKVSDDRVSFLVEYDLDGPGKRWVATHFEVSADGVRCEQRVAHSESPTRFAFPALVNDGARDTEVTFGAGSMRIRRQGGILNLTIVKPEGAKLSLQGPQIPTHNGYVREAVAELPEPECNWLLTLEPAPLPKQ